jgi:hypothetical protein
MIRRFLRNFSIFFLFFFNFDKIDSGNPFKMAERVQFLCIFSNKICFNNKKNFFSCQNKKILTPQKYHFFPSNVGRFWYILVALVKIYKNHILCRILARSPPFWHPVHHPGPSEGRIKKLMSDS